MTGAVTATLDDVELTPELTARVLDMLRRPVRVVRITEVLRLPARQIRKIGEAAGLAWNARTQYMESAAQGIAPSAAVIPDGIPRPLPVVAPTGLRLWRDHAVCLRAGLAALFDDAAVEYATDVQPAATKADLDAAQAACARCPVLGDCQAFAFQRDEYGYWGGMTRTQRRHAQGLAIRGHRGAARSLASLRNAS